MYRCWELERGGMLGIDVITLKTPKPTWPHKWFPLTMQIALLGYDTLILENWTK